MADRDAFLTRHPLGAAGDPGTGVLPGHGGVVSFQGVVRNLHDGRLVTGIEYVAYEEMAEREAALIVREAEARWPVRVTLRHRLGALNVGEVAVVVVIAAAHRGEAFTACRWVIDEVKRRVPIWKHESYADGSSAWVDPTAPGTSR
ncbi:MAG: molybdenum cofactor biosynthesis protein MoaE [Gemmatimonadetes bacterium]|nr:molybdenum cofactor biosynthesis protein MoaE [Gemmatimonadota bacterium]MCA9762446.1 molybdenum cofactor biosynthesis protein MoaE [Gemmatimonadota bacterium]MCB9517554.1 molybdenum cofactor biosynthesis protein MoaE [Gemmatimonadales bacterium]HPF60817.1 molybdenum cofactor biosynthesis protein MoaE [Gemmatimonadales bacterium]HRX18108.1 molybdenum cofactor biosynthesis protein MoaE [Gemmatimonadales bacterium]